MYVIDTELLHLARLCYVRLQPPVMDRTDRIKMPDSRTSCMMPGINYFFRFHLLAIVS